MAATLSRQGPAIHVFVVITVETVICGCAKWPPPSCCLLHRWWRARRPSKFMVLIPFHSRWAHQAPQEARTYAGTYGEIALNKFLPLVVWCLGSSICTSSTRAFPGTVGFFSTVRRHHGCARVHSTNSKFMKSHFSLILFTLNNQHTL